MRNFLTIAAAAAVIGLVTPAAAQSINVRIGDGGGYQHRHSNYHPGYRARPQVVVVQKRRHWDRGYHRGYANRPAVVIAR